MATSVLTCGSVDYQTKVSSVLNKDTKTYGKQFLFDGSEETCWNSDEGLLQWVVVKFDSSVSINEVAIQFQGGFACSQCNLLSSKDGSLVKVQEFYPKDSNIIQRFVLKEQITTNMIKIIMEQPTDTYGRVIVYQLDLLRKT